MPVEYVYLVKFHILAFRTHLVYQRKMRPSSQVVVARKGSVIISPLLPGPARPMLGA